MIRLCKTQIWLKKQNCVYRKTDDIYKVIAEDVNTRFDTSYYKLEWNSIERHFCLKEETKKLLD